MKCDWGRDEQGELSLIVFCCDCWDVRDPMVGVKFVSCCLENVMGCGRE